jgi:hypothetical protein
MATKIGSAIFGIVFSALLFFVIVDAQQQRFRQTDPDDIVTRNRIDRDLYEWLNKLDWQIQADTVLLTSGTSQVVQLDRKYPNVGYQIFLTIQVTRGTHDDYYVVVPTTDSSFTVTKNDADLSTIMWMTVYK